MIRRPITRLCLVAPHGGREAGVVDAVSELVTAALGVHGIQVARRARGSPAEAGPRADAAVWFPDVTGELCAPDPREVAARVHIGFVVDPVASVRGLHRFDALVVPHAALEAPLRAALSRAAASAPPVHVVRLPADAAMPRETEKAVRNVPSKPVVLVDVRDGFSGAIDRIVFQLALKSQDAALVLLAPHDEAARTRVRQLCARHGVDAWLSSSPDGVAASAGAVDIVIGRPMWDEVLVLAAHRVAVSWLGGEAPPQPLTAALRQSGAIDEVGGVLQLAAALDRRLADPKSAATRGIALRELLIGPERAFLDVLGSVEPKAQGPFGASAWEAVGPHADGLRAAAVGPVEGVEGDATTSREPPQAARIEEQLAALKARIREEGRP